MGKKEKVDHLSIQYNRRRIGDEKEMKNCSTNEEIKYTKHMEKKKHKIKLTSIVSSTSVSLM